MLLYFLWLVANGFLKLITFQSMTANPYFDIGFSLALIITLVSMVIMAVKPKWWNIVPAFVSCLSALAFAFFLMATWENSSQFNSPGLAGAGYFTALIQLVFLFILLSIVTLLISLTSKKSSTNAD